MKYHLIHSLVSLCFFAGSLSVAAQETTTESTQTINLETSSWAEAKPGDITDDWIQTTSGEWITGEIIQFHIDVLEFDSDEFGDIKIDLDDIQYIKSHWPQALRFEGNVQATGTIELIGENFIVTSDEGEKQVFPRSELLAMTTGEGTESSYWAINITLGINIRKGNSDEVDYSAKTSMKRRTTESRFLFDYLGNFSTVEDVRTVNNHRVTSNFDIIVNRHFFWQPVFGEYFRDRFQNTDRRILLGAGLGHYIIKTSKTEWDISGGPAIQQTRFVTVQPGKNNDETTPSLSVVSNFETEINSKVDLKNIYNISIVEQDSGGYTHYMITTLETEITQSLDFDVSLVWNHTAKPTTREDGTIPERNDTQMIIGLKFEF